MGTILCKEMKKLNQYINEKYLIDNSVKSTTYVDVKKYKKVIDSINSILREPKIDIDYQISVVTAFKNRNVNLDNVSFNTKEKLIICRWVCSVLIEWDEGIKFFAKEILFRVIFDDINILHAFIIDRYNNLIFDSPLKRHYKHYLELYNIEV